MKILNDIYTPVLHFKAPFGWLNDPNGLMYANEQWHLFYQHYPMSNVWGPMHWGHAVSEDLVHWVHCPIAIAPDELGTMFSGSGIIDKQNDSGIFDGPSDNNLIIFYTASLHKEGQDDYQTQCLAYSKDCGLSWIKYEHNPVIPNPGLACYRDPKVVWIDDSRHWVLLVTHGQSVGIYKSTNLISWELCSEFGDQEGLHSDGPWECPDLFPLTTEDGVTKWILVVGIGNGCDAPGSGTQYFVGDFNGEQFTNGNPADTILYLDNGRDYYATQSWFNAPSNKRVGISWMSNWRYARDTETLTFRSIMTLPREFYLTVDTEDNYVVAQSFANQVNEKFSNIAEISETQLLSVKSSGAVYKITGQLNLIDGHTSGITLFGEDRAQFVIEYHGGKITLSNRRVYHGSNPVMKQEFPHDYQFSKACNESSVSFELIADNGAVELLLDEGRISITQLYYPENPEGNISLSGQGWSQVKLATCKQDIN